MVTKGYGFAVDDIDWSCPADLEPYAKAYNMEQKHNDNMAWLQCGNYLLSAFSVALEHCLAGNKAKSEYIKEPLFSRIDEMELSQDERDERALKEMLCAEMQWQMVAGIENLPKTIIK